VSARCFAVRCGVVLRSRGFVQVCARTLPKRPIENGGMQAPCGKKRTSANSRGCAMTPSFAFPQSLAETIPSRTIAEFVGLEKPKKILAKFCQCGLIPFRVAFHGTIPASAKLNGASSLRGDRRRAAFTSQVKNAPSKQSRKPAHDCHYLPFSPVASTSCSAMRQTA